MISVDVNQIVGALSLSQVGPKPFSPLHMPQPLRFQSPTGKSGVSSQPTLLSKLLKVHLTCRTADTSAGVSYSYSSCVTTTRPVTFSHNTLLFCKTYECNHNDILISPASRAEILITAWGDHQCVLMTSQCWIMCSRMALWLLLLCLAFPGFCWRWFNPAWVHSFF